MFKSLSSDVISAFVVLLFLAAVSFFIFYGEPLQTKADFIIQLISAVFAAYFGAALAIRFQEEKEAEKDRRSRIEFINLTIFELILRLNYLKQTSFIYLDHRGEAEKRHIEIPASHLVPPTRSIDISKLYWALSRRFVSLCQDVALADKSLQTLLWNIEIRLNAHVATQLRLSTNGVDQDYSGTKEAFIEAIGLQNWRQLIVATDSVIEILPSLVGRTEELISQLRAAGEIEFPGEKFHSFQWEDGTRTPTSGADLCS